MKRIVKLFKKIFAKSRLKEYEDIILYAKSNGYILTSLIDWYENMNHYIGKKVIILRHDVDYSYDSAFKLAQIEMKHNVISTYYYRKISSDYKTMKFLHNKKFEISFHFETIVNYCKKNKIKNPAILNEKDFKCIIEELKQEIIGFKNKYWDIKTICSHGHKLNRESKITNRSIIKEISREKLGVLCEAYDDAVMNSIDCYISDSSINNGYKWRQDISPQEAIDKGFKTICLLTHPEHWNKDIYNNIKDMIINRLDE